MIIPAKIAAPLTIEAHPEILFKKKRTFRVYFVYLRLCDKLKTEEIWNLYIYGRQVKHEKPNRQFLRIINFSVYLRL